MTNRIFIPGITLGLLLFTALSAQAMSEPELIDGFNGEMAEMTLDKEGRGHHQGHRLEMMATVLDLSDSQQEQIRTLFADERSQHKEARQQLRGERESLNDLMRARPFDEAAFREQAQQLADLRIEMMVEKAQLKEQVFAILTPEQQAKADELWTLMSKRHRGRGMKH